MYTFTSKLHTDLFPNENVFKAETKKNPTDSDRTDNDDVEVQTGTDQLSPLTRHRAIFNLRNMSVFTHSLRRNSATVTGSTWNKK